MLALLVLTVLWLEASERLELPWIGEKALLGRPPCAMPTTTCCGLRATASASRAAATTAARSVFGSQPNTDLNSPVAPTNSGENEGSRAASTAASTTVCGSTAFDVRGSLLEVGFLRLNKDAQSWRRPAMLSAMNVFPSSLKTAWRQTYFRVSLGHLKSSKYSAKKFNGQIRGCSQVKRPRFR